MKADLRKKVLSELSAADKIKHFRVDKMLNISKSVEPRDKTEMFADLDMAEYAKKSFNMFDGEEQHVKLRLKNEFAGIIIDRFGTDVIMIPDGEDQFTVTVFVKFSLQFIHWVFSLGDGASIIGPEKVLGKVHNEISRLNQLYKS